MGENLRRCYFRHSKKQLPQGKRREIMKNVVSLVWKLRIWKDTRGQDLIEYALMAGFVAVAAGAIMPGVATSISTIFSKVKDQLEGAAAQGTGS